MEVTNTNQTPRCKGTVCTRIRQMDRGHRLTLPINDWSRARTCASMLKRYFGCKFRVNKKNENFIVVTRTK